MKKAVKRKLKLLTLAKGRDTARCIFCMSPNVTHEHVFSKWMHPYLDTRALRANGIIQFYGRKGIETVTFKFKGPLRHWQIKCVCGGDDQTCNNGWMRKLEEEAEPILAPLMQGQETRILEADQKLIATWAILKVMVVNHQMVHHLQHKQMMKKRVPPSGWGVWIGNYNRKEWLGEWLPRAFAQFPEHILARKKNHESRPNSHTTTQIFKKLLIHVVYCRERAIVTKWRFHRPGGAPLSGPFFKIWPPAGHSIKWPGAPLADQDALVIADSITHGLMAVAQQRGLMPISPPNIRL